VTDDYPTEEELSAISRWPIADLDGLWNEIARLWRWPDFGLSQERGLWRLATGGWSGNEDIIAALASNLMFWTMCWQRSERGGLHWFKPYTLDRLDNALER